MNNHLTIYTDGSVYPNPNGIGGWGFVCPEYGETKEVYEYYGSAIQTTNNRMELTAAISALGIVPRGSFVTIVTDSQYVQRCMARKCWPESKPNADLGRCLEDAKNHRLIDVQMVAGHSGDRWNDRAHELADKARLDRVEVEKRAREENIISTTGESLGNWSSHSSRIAEIVTGTTAMRRGRWVVTRARA